MSNYTKVCNEVNANLQSSGSLLGTIEAGSSYTLDTDSNAVWESDDKGIRFPSFEPGHEVYYIPDQSVHAPYPHWFLVQDTDADTATIPNAGPSGNSWTGYVVFSQASAGAPWLDMYEPYLVSGATPAPRIATDAQGDAIAVSPRADAAGLKITPGQVASVTANAADGQAASAIELPANLGDLWDEHADKGWQNDTNIGAGSVGVTDVSLTHWAGSDPVFGLRTVGGGAILFYDLNAQVSLSAEPGYTINLEIPGFEGSVTSAEVPYVDQFAAYDPPEGHASPRIIADTSGAAYSS